MDRNKVAGAPMLAPFQSSARGAARLPGASLVGAWVKCRRPSGKARRIRRMLELLHWTVHVDRENRGCNVRSGQRVTV
jgi:hypothetical protein